MQKVAALLLDLLMQSGEAAARLAAIGAALAAPRQRMPSPPQLARLCAVEPGIDDFLAITHYRERLQDESPRTGKSPQLSGMRVILAL